MHVGDWIALACAVLGSGALGAMWRKLQGVAEMAEDVRGRPERRDPMSGVVIDPGRASLFGRLAATEHAVSDQAATIAAILKELHPNSGSSARDVLDRIEKRLDAIEATRKIGASA